MKVFGGRGSVLLTIGDNLVDTDDMSGGVSCAAIDAATDHTNGRPEHESRSDDVCQSNDPSAVLRATYSTDRTS